MERYVESMKLNNKVLFLNLPLFHEVLEHHKKAFSIHNLDSIIACGHEAGVCELNPYGFSYTCTHCKKMATKFSNYVGAPIHFVEFNDARVVDESSYYEIASNYTLSLYRDENINERGDVNRYKFKLDHYCQKLETLLVDVVDKFDIDSLYFFNSRFPSGQSAKNACKIEKIDYITYDCFALTRIIFSKNESVLNPENLAMGVDEELGGVDRIKLLEFGDTYLNAKLENKFIAYDVFTDRQKINLLPKGLPKQYICFFTSSEDEMIYFGSDLDFPMIDQFQFITELALIIIPEIHIVVRIHPNQESSYLEKKFLTEFDSSTNITVVSGSSSVSTYTLMRKSSLNVSFGSSTAIESTLMRVPAILVGRSIYDRTLDITQIDTVIDLTEIINNQLDLQKISDSQYLLACKWAAYISGHFAAVEYRSDRENSFFLHLDLSDKLERISIRLLRILSYPGIFLARKILIKYQSYVRKFLE
jgi:hypothetical protein